MSLHNSVAFAEPERDVEWELAYLYRRLSTVNNLIKSLQDYERIRPKPAQLPREKTA